MNLPVELKNTSDSSPSSLINELNTLPVFEPLELVKRSSWFFSQQTFEGLEVPSVKEHLRQMQSELASKQQELMQECLNVDKLLAKTVNSNSQVPSGLLKKQLLLLQSIQLHSQQALKTIKDCVELSNQLKRK